MSALVGVDAIDGLAARPVGRFQTETALIQLAGVEELIRQALDEAAAAGRRPGRRRDPASAERGRRHRPRRARRVRDPPQEWSCP